MCTVYTVYSKVPRWYCVQLGVLEKAFTSVLVSVSSSRTWLYKLFLNSYSPARRGSRVVFRANLKPPSSARSLRWARSHAIQLAAPCSRFPHTAGLELAGEPPSFEA